MQPRPFVERANLGFAWSVKDSFLQYIRGMNDGDIGWRDGATVASTGEFYFPLAAVDASAAGFRLSFRGEVRFTAHRGLLSVSLRNPRIDLHRPHAELLVETGSGVEQIATIELPPLILDGDVAMWLNSPLVLAGAGPELFGGVYPLGEQLAPLTLRIPVSSGADQRSRGDGQ